MKQYKLSNEARQQFIITLEDGDDITIEIRWLPATAMWIAALLGGDKLDGEVHAVRLVGGVPIFKQYGYKQIFFVTQEEEIGRDLSETLLIIPTEEEQEGTRDTIEIVTVGVQVT